MDPYNPVGGFANWLTDQANRPMQNQYGQPITMSPTSGENGFFFQDPGQIDLSQQNPMLWAAIQSMQGDRASYLNNARDSWDRGAYDMRTQELQDRNATSLANQYAAQGLGGSSLALGGIAESGRQLGMSRDEGFYNRLNQTQQVLSGLDSQVYNGIQGAQRGFSDYQNAMLQAYLGDQAQKNQLTSSLFSGIGSIAGTVAGFALGGPAGGLTGSALGSNLRSGVTQVGTDYGFSGMYQRPYGDLGGWGAFENTNLNGGW